jgi:hypothetical protein
MTIVFSGVRIAEKEASAAWTEDPRTEPNHNKKGYLLFAGSLPFCVWGAGHASSTV